MNLVNKTGRRLWKLVNKTEGRVKEPGQYDRKTGVEPWSVRQKEELRNLDEQMLSYKVLLNTNNGARNNAKQYRSAIINTMEPEVKPGYKSINTFSNISMMV